MDTPAIDRATAARLNPYISAVMAEDTFENLILALRDFGHMLAHNADDSDGESMPLGNLHLMAGVFASALEYEADNLPPRPASRRADPAK